MLISFTAAMVFAVLYVLGASIDDKSESGGAPTLLEQCPVDLSTNTAYHISLLGLHVDDPNAPVATSCGPPKGSSHFNLHFDQCKNTNCHGCSFPFRTYDQYKALESQYLVPINNWHAFVYAEVVAEAAYQCVCLYDSVSGDAIPVCFTNDIKSALLDFVDKLQEVAQDVWLELVDLPWYSKAAIIVVVAAALIALFPEVVGALIAAGVAITADLAAEAAASLAAVLASSFGIL